MLGERLFKKYSRAARNIGDVIGQPEAGRVLQVLRPDPIFRQTAEAFYV